LLHKNSQWQVGSDYTPGDAFAQPGIEIIWLSMKQGSSPKLLPIGLDPFKFWVAQYNN
jgi:hypothetical protein